MGHNHAERNRPIIVTGFEPFSGFDRNPSQEVAQALDGLTIEGHPVQSHILPVDTNSVADKLTAIIETAQPVALISLGLAAGYTHIHLERIGVNLLDFAEPDNSGNQRLDVPIVENGPTAYFSTLPLRPIEAKLKEAGIPVTLSESAGLYLCNQVLYLALHHNAHHHPDVPTGFIHLPLLPSMAAQSRRAYGSISFDLQVAAVRLAVETTVQTLQTAALV